MPIILLAGGIFFLFRRKQIDFTARRALDNNLVLSPVSGTVHDVDGTQLVLKINLLDDYGFFMPFYGEVKTYLKEKDRSIVEFCSHQIEFAKFSFPKGALEPRVYIDSGDKASAGAFLGYFPFGSKVTLELPENCEILVKKGDILQSSQTILASI